MRATLRLPGVSSVGISAKPRIRGGLQDELLVLQDGIELLEPFHLADYHSAYSTIDYRTIESLDMYTGGFPSRYGNRISGVMDIRNQWQHDSYDTDIGVSSFSNFIHTRSQLGEARPVNWLLSLRQGDLTDLTDYIETRAGEPEYLDASARVNAVLSEAISLAAGAAYAADDIRFEDEEETASARLDTRYLWGSLNWHPAAPVHSRLTLSHINSQRKKQLQSFEDEEKGGLLIHRQEVDRLALRNDWWIIRDNRLWEFGWQAEYSESDYNHISLIDRGELADLLDTPRDIARTIRERPAGWSGGAYLQLEWDLNEGLTVQPSLRWDTQDYYIDRGIDHQLSPRLGLAYQWDEATRLRLSLGRFRQPEGVQELQVLDGITRFYRPQYADQLVAGIERTRGDLELVAEVYYKRYGDLKERFENMFNPFVLLPEMEPDRVRLDPDRAVARGFAVRTVARQRSLQLHGRPRPAPGALGGPALVPAPHSQRRSQLAPG
jgi:outer membrane receptor protein involved in Fe transport